MPALDLFTYGDQPVRAKLIDGEPCILLADVIAGLEMKSSASQVAQRLPDGVRKTDPIVDSLGRTQQAIWVTEAGFYRVVLRSNSPKAEAFIEWVTEDVLPTIRKTGSYGSGSVDMIAALPAAELVALVGKVSERLAETEARAELAEAEVKELAPAAQAWHDIAGATGSWAAREAAQMLRGAGVDIGQNRLLAKLDELGWTFWQGGQRHIKQAALEAGLLATRAYAPGYKPSGERFQLPPQIRVTGKGLDKLLAELGPHEVVEDGALLVPSLEEQPT